MVKASIFLSNGSIIEDVVPGNIPSMDTLDDARGAEKMAFSFCDVFNFFTKRGETGCNMTVIVIDFRIPL